MYTDDTSKSETIIVPNLVGYTPSEVNSVASAYGLNVLNQIIKISFV